MEDLNGLMELEAQLSLKFFAIPRQSLKFSPIIFLSHGSWGLTELVSQLSLKNRVV